MYTQVAGSALTNVTFGRVAWEIDYSEEGVTVYFDDETSVKAEIVLVTVPLGYLKKDYLVFTPALPEAKQNAIKSELTMGVLNKAFISFSEVFWDENAFMLTFQHED